MKKTTTRRKLNRSKATISDLAEIQLKVMALPPQRLKRPSSIMRSPSSSFTIPQKLKEPT